jgi:hypothetical protein
MLRSIFTITALAAAVLSTGCASIVNGQNQSLSVKTNGADAEVVGAKCTLNSNKGTWYVTTPGSVTVQRSYNDMMVTCKKDGMDDGTGAIKSSTKAMAFGNILFGGIIGAAVDTSTGAAYDYPDLITIVMGKNSALGGPAAATPAAAASKANDTTSINARQNPFAAVVSPPPAPAAATAATPAAVAPPAVAPAAAPSAPAMAAEPKK